MKILRFSRDTRVRRPAAPPQCRRGAPFGAGCATRCSIDEA
ncbi:hypothetical protein AXX16_0955 [Serratia rubidaea]|nr:hypothetical protein AXX16_0955 [Serratia rubidaea]